jgi:hypothetical protein
MDKLSVVEHNTHMEITLYLEDYKVARQGRFARHLDPTPPLLLCGDWKG